MTDRVLDLSERPARLSVRNHLLVIDFGSPGPDATAPKPPRAENTPADDAPGPTRRPARDPATGLRARDTESQTIPFAEIAVVVAAHPQILLTHAVLAGLAGAGAILVACDQKHMPSAMLLPLSTHSTQAERFAAQAGLPLPNRKRLWQQIVRSKILAQARLLRERRQTDCGLETLAPIVRSGDPGNVEARAARIYWKNLFGDESFRRSPEGGGLNAPLNYGYAVLRAVVARALCASGLHPSLGIHHHNRYDAFCLADDLMEPFRPLADRAVARLIDDRGPTAPLDSEAKRVLLGSLLRRYVAEGESRTLFDWVQRAASSLAAAVEYKRKEIQIPLL